MCLCHRDRRFTTIPMVFVCLCVCVAYLYGVCVYVCACPCVCVREREREREVDNVEIRGSLKASLDFYGRAIITKTIQRMSSKKTWRFILVFNYKVFFSSLKWEKRKARRRKRNLPRRQRNQKFCQGVNRIKLVCFVAGPTTKKVCVFSMSNFSWGLHNKIFFRPLLIV